MQALCNEKGPEQREPFGANLSNFRETGLVYDTINDRATPCVR